MFAPRGDFSARERREIGIARNREPRGSVFSLVDEFLAGGMGFLVFSRPSRDICVVSETEFESN